MSVRKALVILAAFSVIPAAIRAEEGHQHGGGDPEKLGSVRFENSCSRDVQASFGQAMAMLHSFWYEEARRRFGEAAEKDPKCAVAWWGVAMTHWQPLWEPRGPNRESFQQGLDAIRKAGEIGAGTPRERDYIAALAQFFEKADTVDHRERVLAYENATQRLHELYPADVEARIFHALSLLASATSLPPDKTYARQRRSGELLVTVYAERPDHPGIAHYIIHAYDYPALAAGALDAARRYAKIAPDSPHAQHMPSHIFTRLGLWDESIVSNRHVIRVARQHDVVGEELHAMDYLAFAHLQKGEDELARAILEEMPAIPAPNKALYFASVHAHAAIPARFAVERRAWAEAARLPEPKNFPGGRYAWADAAIYHARAVGASRSGKLGQARADVAKLASLLETLKEHEEDYWATQVDIQHRSAQAWLAFAEGRRDKALELMRSAAVLEDSTDKHPVTPGQIVPARDLLGQMLLELGLPRDARVEFAAVLKAEPNRFGALYGAALAAERAGDITEARALYAKLVEIAPDSQRASTGKAKAFLAASEANTAVAER